MLLFCADPGRCGPAPTHEFPWRCHIQRMRRATARTDGILRHAVGTGRETSARAAIFAPGWGAETAPAVPAPAPCESRGSPVAEPVSMSRFRNSILASLRGLDTMWARTPHRTRRSAASSTRAAGGMKFMVSPHTQYLPCLLRVIEGFMKDVLSLPRGGSRERSNGAEEAAEKVVPATPVAPASCRLPGKRKELPAGSRRYVTPLQTFSAASEVPPFPKPARKPGSGGLPGHSQYSAKLPAAGAVSAYSNVMLFNWGRGMEKSKTSWLAGS